MIVATEENANADRVQGLAQVGRARANIRQWVRRTIAMLERHGEQLTCVIWHLGDETPRDLRMLRSHMAETVRGVRWLLVTDDETRALALEGDPLATGLDKEGRRTCRTVMRRLERQAIRAMTFARPMDPALGGTGERRGSPPHTPWAQLVHDDQLVETATVDGEGGSIKDADGIIIEDRRAERTAARRAERRLDAIEARRLAGGT